MLRFKLPLAPTQAEQTLGEDLRQERKRTKKHKGKLKKVKTNEISTICSCLYTLGFFCNKTQGYSLSKEKEKSLQRECSSLLLLLKNAVKSCRSTNTWIC